MPGPGERAADAAGNHGGCGRQADARLYGGGRGENAGVPVRRRDLRPGMGLQVPVLPLERRVQDCRSGKIRLWLQRRQRRTLP